jgi:hypothetical protein
LCGHHAVEAVEGKGILLTNANQKEIPLSLTLKTCSGSQAAGKTEFYLIGRFLGANQTAAVGDSL